MKWNFLYAGGCFISLLVSIECDGQTNVGVSDPGYLTSLPPAIPILRFPLDDSDGIQDSVNLVWQSTPHASSYSLQVSKEAGFSFVEVEQKMILDSSFIIRGLETDNTYYWRVNALNVAGEGNYSAEWSFTTTSPNAIGAVTGSSTGGIVLQAPFPNPFLSATRIKFSLPSQTEVILTIYNCLGQPVIELVSGIMQPGEYEVSWDGRSADGARLKEGLYVCVLTTEKSVLLKSLVLKN